MDQTFTGAPALLRSELFAERGVPHGFSTRHGGVSRGALASLNLALRGDEQPEHLVENWRRAAGQLAPWAIGESVALMTQVHGATILRVDTPTGPLETVGPCDGCITAQPGLVLAVRTADCVPVLFAGPGGVGVAHAGWRGVALGVVPATAEALADLIGCSPADLVAAVGPHIQAPAYETGPEVVDALVDAGLPRDVVAVEGARRLHTDLGGAVRWQLERLGIEHEALGLCTATDPRFFSHRRDGAATGRLAGLVGLAP